MICHLETALLASVNLLAKHFETLSLEESRSPDFDLFSDQEEYSEEEVAETMAETMEQYISKTQADYESGVVMTSNNIYFIASFILCLRKKYHLNLKNDMPPRSLRKKYRLNLMNDMPPRRWMTQTLLWKNTSGSRKKKLENVGKCLTGKLLSMVRSDLENDNEKVNIPLFSSPEPSVSCIDDLDFFKDFENEFSAIVYNDALTSKFNFSTEPTLCPQNIDEFDLKDETSLSKYDEVEQNVLYFNDLCPFNIICPDDLKSDKGDDDNEIDMIQSLGGNENTQWSNNQLEGSHDKIKKVFIMKFFVMELNVNFVAWNYLVNGMLFNLINNLYVPFGIPFDPKWENWSQRTDMAY
ncbi:hypothetical protein Tco_0097428 [Tanacetum coccineum]